MILKLAIAAVAVLGLSAAAYALCPLCP